MKHRPEVDGLRGLAVLFVVLYHAQLGCPGGYVGVDIFFVISGYLICNLLENEIQSGTFSYTVFWMRRIRRLLPSLMLVTLFTNLVSWWLLTPDDLEQLGLATAAQPLLAANFVFWRKVQTGYFGDQPEIRPSLHTWSLAVEEQFYLLCPLVLWWFKSATRDNRGRLYLSICVLSWMLSGLLTGGKPVFCYFLLPTRIFEILLGGLLWYVPTPVARRSRELLGSLGFLLILGSVWGFSEHSTFPGWIALIPCLGTALLIKTALPGTRCHRLLALSGLTWLGRISYSVYLWHWPVVALWRYAQAPWGYGERLLLVIGSLAAGWTTTLFLENPVRCRALLNSERQLTRFAIVSAIFCLLTGSCFVWGHGFPNRYSPAALRYFQAEGERGFVPELSLEDLRLRHLAKFGISAPERRPDLFVWGDSHAMAVLAGLDELFRKEALLGLAATKSGSPPFLCKRRDEPTFDPQQQEQRVRLVQDILKERRPKAVLLCARWDYYRPEDFIPGLMDTFRFLETNKIPCWLLLQVPNQQVDVPKNLGRLEHLGRNLEDAGISSKQHRSQSRQFEAWLDGSGFPRSRILDPARLLVNARGICRTNFQGESLYYDSDHVSTAGSRFLQPLYEPLTGTLR